MREGAIEETTIPRNPLDVLAQQIVAICADEEIEVDDLHALVRGAYPFADLSRAAARERARHARRPLPVRRVRRAAAADRLGPHGGRRSAGARARGGWRSRTRARSPTAASSASSSSTAAAGSASSTRRWSTRRAQGQTFLLGASTLADRGDHPRPRARLARARRARRGAVLEGRGRRAAVRAGRADRPRLARARRRSSDAKALATPAQRTTTSTSAPPATCSRTCATRPRRRAPSRPTGPIVVERFRDEIGDWRVCILTPFGGRVHAPWALALAARLRDSLGLEVQSLWSDDGIALHLPDADVPPSLEELLVAAGRARGARRAGGRADARSSAPASARTPPARC